METETKTNYSIPIVIILAGIIIAGAMYFNDGRKTEKPTDQPLIVDIKNVNVDDDPFIGNPNAPVVIAEWFDYQCPACRYADQNIITPLVADYVRSGQVKIVFKDYAFMSADSFSIALTARAVWEAYPDKFYQWHKVFFDNQGSENTGWATKEVINSLTSKVPGIDLAVIDGMITKNLVKYQTAMEADKQEGLSFGIRSTPSFIIGDKLQVGAPQYSSFKILVDSLLK